MFFKIYKTTNLANNKIYVGQTHYDRADYFGSGVLISEALEKYGKENFVKEYIDSAFTQEELDKKEIFWIKELDAQNRNIGYNIADGGWNYFTMTEETKKKISKTLKGKYVGDNAFRKGVKLTNDHKLALSKFNLGKTLSAETRKKISESNKGKIHSEESRKKMAESHKGKTLSDEHKKKISESGKGRSYTQEQKEQLRKANLNKTQRHSRTILALCIKTNIPKKFNNVSEAARFFNTTRQRVKNNTVADWDIIVNDPLIHINDLKNKNNERDSTSYTG
jgi:group I intron endonuclease